MLTYSFSIFVRGYVALSGLLVFFVTASLFGAEGRGVIGYGISIFAALAMFLSLNLGRVYLSSLIDENENKDRLLFHCLILNLIASLLTMLAGIGYWMISETAQSVLSRDQIMGFSLMSFFYVWSHNGHIFYSSFLKTKVQDFLVFVTRTLILAFLGILVFFHSADITLFIWEYSLILFTGTLVEMLVIKQVTKSKINREGNFYPYFKVIRSVLWPHMDYILFHIFPLLLMVMSASHLALDDVGRVNFATQMINLIFLFSTTANMRVNAYVAHGGIQDKFIKFWQLLAVTTLASFLTAGALYVATHFLPQIHVFSSFAGTSELFLISLFSVPGFILFQFFNPIWIETHKLKMTVSLQLINFMVCLSLSPYALNLFGAKGFLGVFSLFYLNNIPIHLWLYWRVFHHPSSVYAKPQVLNG